jgi:hypothetical protein
MPKIDPASPRAMTPEASKRSVSAFGILLLATPALVILLLISIYAVNVPYWDQWDEVPRLIEKMNSGTLGLPDFFAQHNEHRIFFPRLIMFGLALLTRWNIKVELVASWILACISAYNLWRLCRVTGFFGSTADFWLLFAANVLLFTPLQSENWLWGFQIGFFLPVTAFTSLLWIVASSRTSVAFLSAVAFSIVTNFSVASGFVSWILAFLSLIFPHGKVDCQGRKGWLTLFLLIFMGSQILYLWNYQKPTHHPSTLIAIHQPVKAMEYILAYFGSAFALGTAFSSVNVAVIVGAILVILFGTSATYIVVCRKDYLLVERALPWVALCLYSASTNILTAIGRMGFGTEQALSSRYVTFSVMMPIGLLFLMRVVFVHWRQHNTAQRYQKPVIMGITSLIAILALLLALSSLASLRAWAKTRHDRICAEVVIQLINVIDVASDFCKYVYPLTAREDACKKMAELGYLHLKPVKTKQIREIAEPASRGTSSSGFFDELTQSADAHVTATGWSVLPERKEGAVATLLTFDDDHGQPNIFAVAFQDGARPNVVAALNLQGYLESGWSCGVDTVVIPPGRRVIKAWAFEPETCRAYELNGAKAITDNR